jgi:DNA polymerase III subunit chi
MTQISFYSIANGDDLTRLQIACRLAEKAHGLGHRIFIQVSDEQQQRQLDDLLWQFKASSFIPHATGATGAEAVEIGIETSTAHQDVLINLSSADCKPFMHYGRINEIVGPDEDSLNYGRTNYRYYQAQGFKPENYKI